jgi:hypothetical protein
MSDTNILSKLTTTKKSNTKTHNINKTKKTTTKTIMKKTIMKKTIMKKTSKKKSHCFVHNIIGINKNNNKKIFNIMCNLSNIKYNEIDNFHEILKDKLSLMSLRTWNIGKEYIRYHDINDINSISNNDILFCEKNKKHCEKDDINIKCKLYKSNTQKLCVPTESIRIFQKGSIVENNNGQLFEVIDYYHYAENEKNIHNLILFKKLIKNDYSNEYILSFPSGDTNSTKYDSDGFPSETGLENVYKMINDIYLSLEPSKRHLMKIWFVGHSLGSTLAQRLAYNIALKKNGISPNNIRLIISSGYIHFTKKECDLFKKIYYGKYLSYSTSIKIKTNENNINEITDPDFFLFIIPKNDKELYQEYENKNINEKNMINNIIINFEKNKTNQCNLYFKKISKLNMQTINAKTINIEKPSIFLYHYYKSVLKEFVEII